ncbi:sugar phosphate isomerase/epimerase [Nonomuraea sp. NPDC026600]|uniref:sugar phosphate isomerase/epimerase family protein n=1 Tax=Nonomuraea sp. NPDC026600 TaxID=3155363 RepID=UPI0033C7B43D
MTEQPLPRLGVCAAAFGDCELSQALISIGELGLNLIDLPTDSTLRLLPDIAVLEDASFGAHLVAMLDQHQMKVGCVSNSRDTQLLLGPYGPHTDPICAGTPQAKRAHALRHALATVRLAAAIGAPQVRLYFGCPDFARWLTWGSATVSWEDNIEALAAVLIPLLDQCRDFGLRLCVEPHPKQVLFDVHSTRQTLRRLVDYSDVLRICLDPANIATLGYNPMDIVTGWREELGAIHVKDLQMWTGPGRPTTPGWIRYGPQPPIRFRTLGRGDLPWPAMIDTLVGEGYSGDIYIEHEDVLLPRQQSITLAAAQLANLLPATPPEGRTW